MTHAEAARAIAIGGPQEIVLYNGVRNHDLTPTATVADELICRDPGGNPTRFPLVTINYTIPEGADNA
jgi:hypothetical protein